MRKVSLAVLLYLAAAAMPAMAGQGATPSSPAAVTQPATATAVPLPRVRLVATGGTISNRRGGRLTADEIVASVPGLADIAAVDAEQFANVASAQITIDQWLLLARRLNAIFGDDPSLSGIVVTSGTDTLEELAYFLHLTVRDRRPVVVTGSMRNPSQVGYEGPANLLASVLVLQRMGVSLQQMDVPIHILLVAYQAMKTSGHTWPVISEDTQEACLRRLTGRIRFAEGLGRGLLQRSAQQYIDEHREPYLLAFAYGYLQDNDLLGARTEAEKSLMLATVNLVDCIAFVAARIRPPSSARSRPTPP